MSFTDMVTDGFSEFSGFWRRLVSGGKRALVAGLVTVGGAAGVNGAEWAGWTASRLVGSPEPPLPFTVERAFPDVAFRSPIYIAVEPGSGDLVVVQERLPLLRLLRTAGYREAQVFAEFPSEWMVYGIAFDPGFESNRQVYVFMNGPTGHEPRGNRISRFQVQAAPEGRLEPESELRIIEWRSAGHDGGDLAFGSDGMLYITTGDGTTDSDGWVSGQTVDDLLGSVLRIDVQDATPESPYRIPEDNPFVAHPGARGEIWAYGLRNPWRMDIDRQSGQVWVGNNGQDLWETAHLVRAGENYGWSVFEGSHPFYANRQLGPTPHVLPTIEHHHSEFRSLTGGVVYRGRRWADQLDGAYLYGDYSTGRIWGALHDGERMVWHRELADTPLAIAGFEVGPDGDVLIADHLGHAIHRMVRNDAPVTSQTDPFPTRLSETGLFRMLGHSPETQDGVVPYRVNAPAWNDGADAQRWMAVPAGEQPGYADNGPWSFPEGTALAQTLALPDGQPIETRVMLRQQGEWAGYSYLWNEDASDAELAPKEGAVVGLPGGRSWHVPSRAECAVCHNRAANYVLGITGAQLNRPGASGRNQLEEFLTSGFLTSLPSSLPEPVADPYDDDQPLEARARAYLHVNCSICHVESGGGNAKMDLRLGVAPERQAIIDARPQHSTFGLVDAMLVAPGAPERSVLAHRIGQRGSGTGQMPPLGTGVVDERAVRMIRDWIAAIPPGLPVVRSWAMKDFEGDLDRVGEGGRYLRGREAFRKTGCVQCHRFGADGGSVGPALDGVGTRLGIRELLEAVLEPSKTITEGYAIPGTDPPMSTMPPGIVNVLEKEEILDLLYFLQRDGRPKVAAVVTEYRHNSHADIIVSRLLQTDTLDGKGKSSPLELVSLYTDQVPGSDTSRALSAEHGFAIHDSIAGALTLGTGRLAVDGVLLIAEHGDYPLSATGNRVYPKRRFWDEIAAVFRDSARAVPVFVDKHLADNWADARFIFDDAAELGVPLMAGSSLPTTWRRPPADVERSAALDEIVAITFHTTDAYGFHALEFAQALAEQRRGGESGVVAVQSIAGDAVWAAFDDGRFDRRLFDAAWSKLTDPPPQSELRERVNDPRLFSIEHADGLRVHLLELNGAVNEWAGAWRYAGDEHGERIASTLFWTQEGRPGMHFTWLLNGIEQMILTGIPSWNAERTLLTSGVLDALLISLHEGGERRETPHLDVRYQPVWRWKEPPPPPPMRPWAEQ